MSEPSATIDVLTPDPAAAVDDDRLLALYADSVARDWVRVNFVATVDGSATVDGLSGSLGGPADLRVFDLLRRLADVVLVAAGTVRDEGYGAMRLNDADVAWRRAQGAAEHPGGARFADHPVGAGVADHPVAARFADHPVFAIVSGSLSLDPASAVFTDAPVRPIVLTVAAADPARRAALSDVADVVSCSADDPDTLDAGVMLRALQDRGLHAVHCEGGPRLFGTLVAADLVDELCLTVSPSLEGGAGPRVVVGTSPSPRDMRLAHVLQAGDVLLTRHVRARHVRARHAQ